MTFGQTVVLGLVQGSAFASLSVALVMIYRATGVFNFAQGEMAMATTYVMYQINIGWHVTTGWPSRLTMVFAFFFGVVALPVFIRPVERRSIVAVIIVTIALFLLDRRHRDVGLHAGAAVHEGAVPDRGDRRRTRRRGHLAGPRHAARRRSARCS